MTSGVLAFVPARLGMGDRQCEAPWQGLPPAPVCRSRSVSSLSILF